MASDQIGTSPPGWENENNDEADQVQLRTNPPGGESSQNRTFILPLDQGVRDLPLRQVIAYPPSNLSDVLSIRKQAPSRVMNNVIQHVAIFSKFQGWSKDEFWSKAADIFLEILQREGNWLHSKRGVPLKAVMEAVRTPHDREHRSFFWNGSILCTGNV